MYDDSSEARNTARAAISDGRPSRPSGVMAVAASVIPGSIPAVRGVSMTPGQMALTRTPAAAYSSAPARVSCTTPPLLAQ